MNGYQLGAALRARKPWALRRVRAALRRHDGNAAHAAEDLGVTRATLRAWGRELPELGPFRGRGAAPGDPPHPKRPRALVVVTVRESVVHVDCSAVPGGLTGTPTIVWSLRQRFGARAVLRSSGSEVVTVHTTDASAAREAVSWALHAAGREHRWLLGAGRSRAVAGR